MLHPGFQFANGDPDQEQADPTDDELVMWDPVKPKLRQYWRPPDIGDEPPAHLALASYHGRQIFGAPHVEVLTWIPQGFSITGYERVGDTIDLERLELTLILRAPDYPTFDFDVVTAAVIWDRTFPPTVTVPASTRYLSRDASRCVTQTHDTLPDVQLLWAKDFVLDEPRYDAIANPVRPNHQTSWIERVDIDLRGLRTQFYGASIDYQALGPGQLVLVTYPFSGGLPLLTFEIDASWRVFFGNSKSLN